MSYGQPGVPVKLLYPVLPVAGALIGWLVGVITRPAYLGIQMPLEVLTSSAPSDALFKADLTNHLLLTGGIGLAAGVVLALGIAVLFGFRATAPAGKASSFPTEDVRFFLLSVGGAVAVSLMGFFAVTSAPTSYLIVGLQVVFALVLSVVLAVAAAGLLTTVLKQSRG